MEPTASPRVTGAHRLREPGGAIRRGLTPTSVNTAGLNSASFQHHRMSLDAHGHRSEIYGSGGWGF